MSRQAKQQFVGYVRLKPSIGTQAGAIPANGMAVRVESSSLKLSQPIDYPELVDNKVDRTVYVLKPQQVEGDIQFPLIHEGQGLSNTNAGGKSGAACGFDLDSMIARMWKLAAQRDSKGRMLNVFDAQIRYADNLAYTYPGCLINTLDINVKESDQVKCTAGIIGGANINGSPLAKLRNDGVDGNELISMLSPARIVTWNDFVINIYDDNGVDLVLGEETREFSCKLDNQIDKYYTFNKKLLPQDISAKKRKIEGTLKVMGHSEVLSNYTETNENRFSSSAYISFGYKLGANLNPYWATDLYGVVFEIENVSLGTGLFETDTKWAATGDCEHNYEATHLGDANKTSTIEGYPNFSSNAGP